MSHIPIRQEIIPPNISRQQLLDHLRMIDRKALLIKRICQRRVIFESEMNYPFNPNFGMKYLITATVPITDSIFQSEEPISYVFPSKVVPWIEFTFQHYVNREGYQTSQIN